MTVTLAEHAGFCFGVNRAVTLVYDLLKQDRRVCTLGPLIHNTQMVESLAAQGVRVIDSPEEAKPGETLVIRSHGVAREILARANACADAVCDATCPFVAKIHTLVQNAGRQGRICLVAGDPAHEEVKGICGHAAGEVYVFTSLADLQKLTQEHPEWAEKPLTAVSQTTFRHEIFEKCRDFLKKHYTNADVFDTICNATAIRQEKAKELARQSDLMVVVGGRHSSNTAKLAEVCRAFCPRVVFCETAADLRAEDYAGAERIGVVAGASTPAPIIKEVLQTMSENNQSVEQLEEQETVRKSFEEMTDEEAFEASLSELNGDQKVKGTVLAVSENEIQLDIGRGLAGYLSKDEYSNEDVDLKEAVKVGDELDLIIMRTNDQEGTVTLSKRRYDAIAGWDKIVEAKDNETVLSGVVKDVIKGGVVVYCQGIRVFIPASQATFSRNEPLDGLKGKEVSFRIIEIGRGHRAVGSIRSVLREERKAAAAKIWDTIAVGDRFIGTVKSLTSYGAFVDIGGVDGMVHISELSWQRIKNPSEVVLVGDTVEVYVKAVDPEKKKISLGYKKPEENPWVIFQKNYSVGDTVKVTIVNMTTYGAFARIIPGIDGLIHISQIANKRVEKPQDELTVGQEVEVKITAVDDEKKRVSLSIRALLPDEEPAKPEEAAEEPAKPEEAAEEPAKPEEVAEESAKPEEVAEETAPVVEEVAESEKEAE